MTNKEFLQWVHDRMQFVHSENPNVAYMHKLRSIIDGYPNEGAQPTIYKKFGTIDYGKVVAKLMYVDEFGNTTRELSEVTLAVPPEIVEAIEQALKEKHG